MNPSDDSRMKMLDIGLKKIGFNNEAKNILSIWNSMPFVTSSKPIHEYQYAYPTSLMEELAELVLNGINKSGILTINPEQLERLEDTSIRKTLNEAWKKFWTQSNYREWEKTTLKTLNQTYS